jgi:hypothetical protein
MKHHEWDQDKNESLKKTRNIPFEKVIRKPFFLRQLFQTEN